VHFASAGKLLEMAAAETANSLAPITVMDMMDS